MATPAGSDAGRGTPTQERERLLARERKRRQRNRERAQHGPPQKNDHISALIGKAREDLVHEVMREELRPVVREAIDDEIRQSIKMLVGLAPAALLTLANDLQSDDEVIRHKAASLIAKYTLGNPNVTPPRDDTGDKLVIINAMPRPDSPPIEGTPLPEPLSLPSGATPAIEATAAELRRCDTCNLDKPLDQFPGDGPRCATCLEERKQSVIEAFLKPDEREAILSQGALRQPSSAEDVQRPREPRRPPVHQAGEGLQRSDVRQTWTDPTRQADPSGHEGGSTAPWPEDLRDASATFGGPPDPRRFSNG